MLKHPTFALLLSLPLCAFGAGGSLIHSSPAEETSAAVTTLRGERALKIPVQLSVVDWSRAGFPATNTAETQAAWLYLTQTAFQLQDGAGHTLMDGRRSDVGLEGSQCIRMRSPNLNLCANSTFPQTKEGRATLHGSKTEFSWLYYHLTQAGRSAPTAPNGIMLAGNNAPHGTTTPAVPMPVLQCRLVNPDGSVVAVGGPELAVPGVPGMAKPEPEVAPASASTAASTPATVAAQPVAPQPAPEPAKVEVAVAVQPTPQIDLARILRVLAAASQPGLMETAGMQLTAMFESPGGTIAPLPQPQLPIHVEMHTMAPAVTVAAATPSVATHAATHATMSVSTAAPVATPHAVQEDTADFSTDDLTPAGAPHGVVLERSVKAVPVAVAAKPVDSHDALVQAEKEARAARVAEMQFKRAQDLKAIPSTSESKSVPSEKPSSIYAKHITTSTAFSTPAYAGPATPTDRTLAGKPATTAFSKPAYVEPVALTGHHVEAATAFSKPAYSEPEAPRVPALPETSTTLFAQVGAPEARNATPGADQEIAQASDAQAPRKARHVERPAFKSVTLPSPVETAQ